MDNMKEFCSIPFSHLLLPHFSFFFFFPYYFYFLKKSAQISCLLGLLDFLVLVQIRFLILIHFRNFLLLEDLWPEEKKT